MPQSNSAQLPAHTDIHVIQTPGAASGSLLAKTAHLLVVLPEKPPAAVWKSLPNGAQLRTLSSQQADDKAVIRSRLGNAANTGISLARLPGSANGKNSVSSFDCLSFCGGLAADSWRSQPESVAVLVEGFKPEIRAAIIKALLLALAAHSFSMPSYKSKASPVHRLKTVRIFGCDERTDLKRTLAEAKATNLVRWLTAQPPNRLDTKTYLRLLRSLAKQHGWQFSFLGESKLKQVGAGAFLAVSQGNATRDAGIVRIRYRPKKTAKKKPDLALVGKGIIFDTGGTNLKPFKGMLDMHQDMAGSAVAVATLAALTELNAPFAIDCWLAITENRISAEAYKSRDIVIASNGVSIEVIHTDAEGRMALADTLALAGNEKPTAIIDFATLTGSCVAALTERYSGALTNRPELNQTIIEAGQASGERVWPFPMDADFDEEIRSKMADVVQCAAAGGGDHIQAARFLSRFVPGESAWVHVDLSSASRKGGLAQVPGDVTGFGARFALNLILDHQQQLLAAGKG